MDDRLRETLWLMDDEADELGCGGVACGFSDQDEVGAASGKAAADFTPCCMSGAAAISFAAADVKCMCLGKAP